MKVVDKIKSKIKSNALFNKYFSFESGIDITNDNQVLYRKNVVIKNIIFLSNIIDTIIFTIVSISEPSNWLLTVILFPVTFVVNMSLKNLINKGPDDRMSQNVAMYVSCLYMFLSSVLIYVKLKYGQSSYLMEAGYILLYYSLAVCSFYQDKKMLKNISIWVVVLITILHFTVTYSLINTDVAKDVSKVFTLFTADAFKDIIIRTLLLIMFMLVLYVNVSMVNFMQDERKKELSKRREVQEDFTKVVTEIFDVTLSNNEISEDEAKEAIVLSTMVKKLASLSNLKPEESNEVYEFSKIHIDKKVHFNADAFANEDEKFEALRKETELGSKLIARIHLKRECEELIRSTFEASTSPAFIDKVRESLRGDVYSEIILICDLYVTMRSFKSYKRAYNHKITMDYFEKYFKIYFDQDIFDRFMKFDTDFEEIYQEI